jgi:hypothetical protein
VSAEVHGWLADAVGRASRDEDREYFFDFSVQAGIIGGEPVVQYVFVLGTTSPLPGEGPLFHVRQLPFPAPSEDMIGEVVTESVKGLRSLISLKRAALN